MSFVASLARTLGRCFGNPAFHAKKSRQKLPVWNRLRPISMGLTQSYLVQKGVPVCCPQKSAKNSMGSVACLARTPVRCLRRVERVPISTFELTPSGWNRQSLWNCSLGAKIIEVFCSWLKAEPIGRFFESLLRHAKKVVRNWKFSLVGQKFWMCLQTWYLVPGGGEISCPQKMQKNRWVSLRV